MDILKYLKVKTISEEKNKGIFHIEGLPRGYGLTLGNSLRRVILSSIEGAAVVWVKIKGVDHEFSTIPYIKEDVLQIILSLKNVRFKMLTSEPQVAILQVKGEKEVKAGDIECPSQISVINKSLTIAHLTDKKAELSMEIGVEKGIGYVPASERRKERVPIGTIMVDAIFSPIEKVNFSVENMRLGEKNDYNRIILEIETDGSVKPKDVFKTAALILKDQFEKIASLIE